MLARLAMNKVKSDSTLVTKKMAKRTHYVLTITTIIIVIAAIATISVTIATIEAATTQLTTISHRYSYIKYH